MIGPAAAAAAVEVGDMDIWLYEEEVVEVEVMVAHRGVCLVK